jgi:O-antigen ligase/tetratricopeptide (TPR) repeat protein
MAVRLRRLALIILVVYASLVGGVVEQYPSLNLVHQVGVTLLLGVWLVTLWRRERPFPSTPLDVPLLVCAVAWLLAALLGHDPRVSLQYAWPIWVHILIFYFLVDLMRHGRQRWAIEALVFFGSLIVLFSAVEMVSWYWGLPILPQFTQSWPHWFGLTRPPVIHSVALILNYNNPTGAYCVLLIPLTLAWASTIHPRDSRWVLRILALGLVVTLLLTQSRGAYLGLAAVVGVSLLLWLLHDNTRRQFPVVLRPLLDPRMLIGGGVLAGVFFVGGICWLVVNRPGNDIARVDLWTAAIQMTYDHPLLGVGPHQFGAVRLEYPHYEYSPSYLPLLHAHNVYLNSLAEGGVITFSCLAGLVFIFGHIWLNAWRRADPALRLRLEGVLAALVGFGVHNLVDSFIQTQLVLPVLILVAYTVWAGDCPPADARQRRGLVVALIGLLAAIQLVFIPVHWAAMKHQRALDLMGSDRLQEALTAERAARHADPWMDLYRLQEATILGRLADQDPAYLDEAITAYEDALRRSPAWDVGWHNLGALYAQAGYYQEAIQAARTAIAWNSLPSGYYLKLGEYQEALGRLDEARAAYEDALERQPSLASSGFWSDPAYPDRAAFLDQAVNDLKPSTAFGIAVYRGDSGAAARIAQAVPPVPGSTMESEVDALWSGDPSGPACVRCYFVAMETGNPAVRRYLLVGERLLSVEGYSDSLTAEQAARAALFLDEAGVGWGWYELARVEELRHADPDVVDRMLESAVAFPPDYRMAYPRAVYGMVGSLTVLPQAQTAPVARIVYEPWLILADRCVATGRLKDARTIYDVILAHDPYLWDVRAKRDALPGGD